MARPAQITLADITLRLQVGGAMTAVALADRLGVDRSTISRGLSRLGDAVLPLGAARRARYALRRNVRGAGDRWPLHRVTSDGRANLWAQLEVLHGGYRVTWTGDVPAWAAQAVDPEGFVEGVPFFLVDQRPQGFLGRREAQRVSESLRLPADPRQWGDDDILIFLQSEGCDVPGDLVVGEGPLRRLLARQVGSAAEELTIVAEGERAERYPALATRVALSGIPGSSAGGEQPKFLAAVRRGEGVVEPVLVKFSPLLESATGRRWADLLVAEAHALAVLAERGLAEPGAHVQEGGGRRFLEVRRYDRVGPHGRRGVVSLEALHGAFEGGAAIDWPSAAAALARAGLVDAAGLAAVQRLHAFGGLIGNVDMHFGNLSFWLDDTLPFRPAPAYDMLPMAWAPSVQGEMIERPFAPPPPLPATLPAWSDAAGWAEDFWARVAVDPAVTSEFAQRARQAGEQVARLRAHFLG
jgi:hypothetical protein